MESENSSIKTLEGIKLFLNNLPAVSYGGNAIQNLNLNGYGTGQAGFDKLKAEFQELDLSEALESSELDKKIKKQKKDISSLEKKHTSLVAIFW